jgi:(1->4)-alpha-D-glucan 1-alpha-D-glucosylmutase
MTPLRATARLQLHAEFPFAAAAAQVDYYAALGISHLYLSPIGEAVPDSTHFYDQVDPTRISAALGGETGFLALARAAREAGLGILLDIVPNHMAAHADNAWWWDVLAHGRASTQADWFDIDWDAPGRDGKLWLPVLDRPLRDAIADGALRLVNDAEGVVLLHHDLRFPVTGAPAERIEAWCAARNADAGRLEQLVRAQHYRLAWWRTGSRLINYRRFFDIAALAALRIEQVPVFEAVHALPLRLLREGWIDGVRIDHVDGLADPRGYLQRLRRQLDAVPGRLDARPVLLVEKILAPDETLPAGWPCDGTTGYDFMDQVGGVLHASGGEAVLRDAWRTASGRSGDFATEDRCARAEQLAGPLAAELGRTLRALDALVTTDAALRDLGTDLLGAATQALLCEFPVYRTYASADGLSTEDVAHLQEAAARACRHTRDPAVQTAIDALLCALQRNDAAARMFRLRCEHLSAPLNAKAVEDTAFYRHGVLISRNEVGSHPQHIACPVNAFHVAAARRGPRALLATSTHDHKRGADVRTRLALLSAAPAWWIDQVQRIESALPRACDAVEGADRWVLWQTIVGVWPPDLDPDDDPGTEALRARVARWLRKALREAKLRSAWTLPDADYEAAAAGLLDAAFGDLHVRATLSDVAAQMAAPGAIVGLAQAALQLCAPGVPDLYQGCESWDLSLVDPDNRRPVDFALRRRWLTDTGKVCDDWRSGRIKSQLWQRLLQLRREQPALFAQGDYTPLQARGAAAGRVVGFIRRHAAVALCVLVPRGVFLDQVERDRPRWRADAWPGLEVDLPAGTWRDVMTDREVEGGPHHVAALWSEFPLAVLTAEYED